VCYAQRGAREAKNQLFWNAEHEKNSLSYLLRMNTFGFGISQMVNTLFIISSISGSRERYSTISIDLPEIGHTSTFTGRQFSTIDLLGYDADEYNENVWLSGSCKAVVTVPC
jgi:hypothetical protein